MTPTIERADDGAITLRIVPAPAAAPDELRAVSAWATAWGLEVSGLRSALRRAGIPTVKIGRQECCRRSDLLSAVDKLAATGAAKEAPADTYAALVQRARGRR